MAITKIKEPAFHVTGEVGWINDPNGLIYYNGQYHAFFQYYPEDTKWGPMHWGHVVSDDLTNWKYLPIALTPGDDCDKNGCFSGSSIIHNGKMWLMYTGFIENEGGESVRQVQCLAESDDGVTFKKHGVVIGEELLPEAMRPAISATRRSGFTTASSGASLRREKSRAGEEFCYTSQRICLIGSSQATSLARTLRVR